MRGEGAVAKNFSRSMARISFYGSALLEGLAERQVNVMHPAFLEFFEK